MDLKAFLDARVEEYNTPEFISTDPIQIPHFFTRNEDIEISAFLTATIAWGQRKTIINNSRRLMELMNNRPYDFIVSAKESDLSRFDQFCHRTFNSTDLLYFLFSLKNIYLHHGGLKTIFTEGFKKKPDAGFAIMHFRSIFFEMDFPDRTKRHVPDVSRGSAAKRLNMFIRWMARKDNCGVDFGIWNEISPSWLSVPLDVHSGTIARKLGLLTRKPDDWKAVEELTGKLKEFDSADPVKYDFALFGLGAFSQQGYDETGFQV